MTISSSNLQRINAGDLVTLLNNKGLGLSIRVYKWEGRIASEVIWYKFPYDHQSISLHKSWTYFVNDLKVIN